MGVEGIEASASLHDRPGCGCHRVAIMGKGLTALLHKLGTNCASESGIMEFQDGMEG